MLDLLLLVGGEKTMAEVVKAAAGKVKAWYTSVSLWVTVIAGLGLLLDKLALDGVIPNDGWYTIAALVIGLVTKRGLTENAQIKANAMIEATKNGNP